MLTLRQDIFDIIGHNAVSLFRRVFGNPVEEVFRIGALSDQRVFGGKARIRTGISECLESRRTVQDAIPNSLEVDIAHVYAVPCVECMEPGEDTLLERVTIDGFVPAPVVIKHHDVSRVRRRRDQDGELLDDGRSCFRQVVTIGCNNRLLDFGV